MTSEGGVPSALAMSLIGWVRAISTWRFALSCVQASSPSGLGSSSGNGGTLCCSSTSSTQRRCASGIIASSLSTSEPASEAGITTSTPYGVPSTCSSIHVSSISSCSGEKARAPRTPMPPARLTAATTSRQWEKAKELLEHHTYFEACQAGAEAEMRAAGPEGHVRIGVARHIENVSVRKDVLVAVCGAVVHHYLFALAYLLGPDLRVSRDGAAEVDDGGHPAQHLFDRGRYQRWIGEKTIALVGMFDE